MGEIYGKLFNGHTLDENKWDNLSILNEDKAIKVDIFGMVIFISTRFSAVLTKFLTLVLTKIYDEKA